MSREIKTFQVFRTGSHVAMGGHKVTFDINDLKQTAAAYKPSLWRAPLVLGHPATDGPSHGHVLDVYVEGDGLYVRAEVDDELIELVRAGRYTNRSASFYQPQMTSNPSPGVFYLRHVGFLGATPPGVKGMSDLNFSERNPLLMDINERFYCYGESEGIRSENPLIADAEARNIQHRNPNTNYF
ncbi:MULTISPECIES: hypothetical protein [Pseudomonas]|uniref:hypothetical protein n=1 Tax=Pseudomonas TaxID=286 RepID=UPI001C2F6A89|nr:MULTISPECIES: hypothetical protein [Pseudomonas]MBV2081959.1 hypothetical protein [Pseudomonas carnis]MBV2087844.1 hypothetical protein [Pseudomonas carnis]MDO3691755.1 hypothetical protein [Pseudomonas sp. DKN 2791]MDO7033474.1 hypothetical protein [Pseudomonas sp. DKN 2792]